MAFLVRWISNLMSSLQSCIKVPQDDTQNAEEDEFADIYFWEDIVKKEKYQQKVKNRSVRECFRKEVSKDPEIDQTHTEMSEKISLTVIQSLDFTPEQIAETVEESSNNDAENIRENSSIELFNSTEKITKMDDSDTTTTEIETNSSYLTSEDSKTQIGVECSQIETERTGVDVPFAKISNAINTEHNTPSVGIPSTSEDETTSSNSTEPESTSSEEKIKPLFGYECSQIKKIKTEKNLALVGGTNELISEQNTPSNLIPSTSEEDATNSVEAESHSSAEFDAMDIWLEAEDLPLPDSPLVMVKSIEGNEASKEVSLSDILLIVKEQQFRVHQKILRKHSSYFEQRLAGRRQTQCVLHIQSGNVNLEALNIILHFLYENEINTCQNIPQVIQTSLYLEIEIVLKKMEQILDVSNTNSKNALYLYATAWEWIHQLENVQSQQDSFMDFNQVIIKNNDLNLTEDQITSMCDPEHIQAKRFIIGNTLDQMDIFTQVAVKPKIIVLKEEPLNLWVIDVCKTNFENAVYIDATTWNTNLQTKISQSLDFLALHFEEVVTQNFYLQLNTNQVETLFKNDILQTRSEMVVFLAALKWIEYDFLEREEFTSDILKCVRFSQMTKEEIIACYHPPVLMGLIELPEIQDMLHKALQYIVAKDINQEHIFQNLASKPRTLLLKDKTLTLWDMDAFDPNLPSEVQSGTSSESSRNQVQETPTLESSVSQTKKTHLSKFIDLFEDDF